MEKGIKNIEGIKRTVIVSLLLVVLTGCNGGASSQSEKQPQVAETTVAAETSVIATAVSQEEADKKDESAPNLPAGKLTLNQELELVRGTALQMDLSIFQTDEKLYSLAELRGLSDDALAVFRNELYARHGRIFKGEKWTTFFVQFSWYEGQYAAEQFYEQELLSDLEKANLKHVLSVEAERKETVKFTLENYPRVDGSTATIPLSEQFAADALGLPIEEARLYILHKKTHSAYNNLISGEADIIFVTAPSEEELQIAAEAGVEFEIVPIVREGFVFLVNENNPVTSLTQQQVRGIYSGKIQNWKNVGGVDQEIMAFQRPVNSGSQSGMLELVMKDTPIMKAPSELYPMDMGAMIEIILAYDNTANAMGYSYYYYVSSMYFRKGIKLLAIDGVEPNDSSIQDGSYPYTTAYYAVIKKSEPKDSNTRKLLTWILNEGQESARTAGYVPVS